MTTITNEQERAIAMGLAQDKPLADVAQRAGVSLSSVNRHKRRPELRERVNEYRELYADLLQDIHNIDRKIIQTVDQFTDTASAKSYISAKTAIDSYHRIRESTTRIVGLDQTLTMGPGSVVNISPTVLQVIGDGIHRLIQKENQPVIDGDWTPIE